MERSDVEVVLTSRSTNALMPVQKLAAFPGHSQLLCSSPFLKAKVCHTRQISEAILLLFT